MARTLFNIIKPALIACFFACGSLQPLLAAVPFIIDEKFENAALGTHIEYLEDRSGTIALRDIIAGDRSGALQWIPSNEEKLGFGFTKSVYWVRFTVKNPSRSNIEYYLKQAYPLINHLTLYCQDGKGGYRTIETGNRHPFTHRPVQYRSFIIPLAIEAGGEKTCYIRYQSESSVNIQLSALSHGFFITTRDSEIIFFCLYFGILLAMFIYNLIIFFATRDWSYFFYVMYIGSFALFTMSMSGLAFQYLWPDNIWLGSFSTPIAMSAVILTFIPFMITYNNIRHYSPAWVRILNVHMAVTAIILALVVLVFNYHTSINVVTALAGFSAIEGVVWAVHFIFVKKSRPALFFAFALILFFAGVIMMVLQLEGALTATVLTTNGVYVGAVLQVIILSFGFVDRINILRNELYALNAGLELKVLERIAELQTANEEIEAMNENLIETRDALWGEMQLAKKIQTVLLPERPSITGYEISAFMRPASDVGGDYYDIISAAGMDWIVIGDVSGHGVSAGLIMMMAQTSINTIIENEPGIAPSEVLVKVNKTIYQNIKKLNEDKYLTITVLAAHRDGRFVFSGLHQDIMVYRKNRGDVELIETSGMWIGIMDEMRGLKDNVFTMDTGDVVLLYTDGITEAWERGSVQDLRDPDTQLFGDERLQAVFRKAAERPVDDIKNAIIASLNNYDCRDDVTMIIMKRV